MMDEAEARDTGESTTTRSVLRDPPTYAVAQGRLDPDLPICICGEQVAVAHKECIAIFDATYSARLGAPHADV